MKELLAESCYKKKLLAESCYKKELLAESCYKKEPLTDKCCKSKYLLYSSIIKIGPPPVHQLGIMPGSAAVGSARYRRKRQQQEKVRKALREEPG